MGRQQAQHPTKRVGMGTDGGGKIGGGARRFVEGVGHTELGDNMQAARQAVASGNLGESGERIGLHGGCFLRATLPE